jgi:hypothetical protein
MTNLYILQLSNSKWYIGKSNNVNKRIEEHKTNNGAEWPNLHKPILNVTVIPNCDHYDEDKYVKMYMEKYGIDNVRGGSYSKIKLSPEQKVFLGQEILGATDKCFICKSSGHFSSDCPTKNTSYLGSFYNYVLGFFTSKPKTVTNQSNNSKKCYTCNNYGHYSYECKKTQCFKCKEYGHFMKNCKK